MYICKSIPKLILNRVHELLKVLGNIDFTFNVENAVFHRKVNIHLLIATVFDEILPVNRFLLDRKIWIFYLDFVLKCQLTRIRQLKVFKTNFYSQT